MPPRTHATGPLRFVILLLRSPTPTEIGPSPEEPGNGSGGRRAEVDASGWQTSGHESADGLGVVVSHREPTNLTNSYVENSEACVRSPLQLARLADASGIDENAGSRPIASPRQGRGRDAPALLLVRRRVSVTKDKCFSSRMIASEQFQLTGYLARANDILVWTRERSMGYDDVCELDLAW
jgi:hypothetical protein